MQNKMANGLLRNMPKFYCDYFNTYLNHDFPSVRKTHCSGRKQKENVKDYYQKWMEEQAQSLFDKTTTAFQQGKTSYSILCSSFSKSQAPTFPQSLGSLCPGMIPETHRGSPTMVPMMGSPSPGMMPVGSAPGMKQTMGSHMATMLGLPMMRPPARRHDGTYVARNDSTRQIGEKGASFYQLYATCSTSPGDHGVMTLGVF
ncbi:hypothetical protein mRhiFer1_010050 [Rhinolophus ferrumequinum]|uniref:Matrin-type domain-containing protein n=1 Tax=Rhinolophus ferrumequinum TaxID=59479 RepID=A0A7J7Y5D3_RHIFE|nr:hypothetical protein mRhiFer1_010050 [Rhinolophus ferrumequinum]